MKLDKGKLTKVLQAFKNDKTLSYHGKFPKLHDGCKSGSLVKPGISDTINRYASGRVVYGILKIYGDFSSILTICHRLEYQKELYQNNKLDFETWCQYCCEDIDLFFIRYNFVYDKIAEVIRAATDNYLKVRDMSFSHLLEQVNNNELRMDEDFLKLVKCCDWYHYFCYMGIGIKTDGDECIVKLENDEIMFDIFAMDCGPSSNAWTSVIQYLYPLGKKDGYTNFIHYAGVCIGYLIWYLEELSKAILQRLIINENDSRAEIYHPGIKIIRNWILQTGQ